MKPAQERIINLFKASYPHPKSSKEISNFLHMPISNVLNDLNALKHKGHVDLVDGMWEIVNYKFDKPI